MYSRVISSAFKLSYKLFEKHSCNKLGQSPDLLVERLVIEKLRRTVGSFTLISEESGIVKLGSNPRKTFFLDPIDGTGNFMKKIPIFAVSFASSPLQANNIDLDKIDYSIVVSSLGLRFEALKSEGFSVNGVRMTNSMRNSIEVNDSFMRVGPINSPFFRTFSEHVRLLGASSIELCMLASGTFDAFVDFGTLKPTDIAASYLMLKEAGITFSDVHGERINLLKLDKADHVSLVASSSPFLHHRILELLDGLKN
jgi:myo-inositol-1(or 4)-monophosphatase